MAEREKANENRQEYAKQKCRTKQQESRPSFDKSLTWDTNPFSRTETPLYPRVSEHAATLSRIPFSAQRHEFIMHLNNTYGYSYVQRLMESIKVQANLTVSVPNDVYEQEADRVADIVTRNINTPVQRQVPEEEELLQGKSLVQRQTPEEEEVQMTPDLGRQEEEEELQMQATDSQYQEISDNIEKKIKNSRGSGQPLPESIKAPMGQAFSADFDDVRVHTDSEADALNQQLSAEAFTTGPDIYFKQGAYQPATSSGQKLIAHELTHVVQQGGATTMRESAVVENDLSSSLAKEQKPVANGRSNLPLQAQSFAGQPSLFYKRRDHGRVVKSGGLPHVDETGQSLQHKVVQRQKLTQPELLGGSKETSKWGKVVSSIRRYNSISEDTIDDIIWKLVQLESVRSCLVDWRQTESWRTGEEGSSVGFIHKQSRREKRRLARVILNSEIPRENSRLERLFVRFQEPKAEETLPPREEKAIQAPPEIAEPEEKKKEEPLEIAVPEEKKEEEPLKIAVPEEKKEEAEEKGIGGAAGGVLTTESKGELDSDTARQSLGFKEVGKQAWGPRLAQYKKWSFYNNLTRMGAILLPGRADEGTPGYWFNYFWIQAYPKMTPLEKVWVLEGWVSGDKPKNPMINQTSDAEKLRRMKFMVEKGMMAYDQRHAKTAQEAGLDKLAVDGQNVYLAYRSDKHLTPEEANKVGKLPQVEHPERFGKLNMHQPWHPYSDGEIRKKLLYRGRDRDNCKFTIVSIAREFWDCVKFPLVQEMKPEDIDTENAEHPKTTVGVYMMSVRDVYDPMAVPGTAKWEHGEFAVRRIEPKGMLVHFEVERTHNLDREGILKAEAGYTAEVKKFNLLAGAGEGELRVAVQAYAQNILSTKQEYKGAG